jgi:hypothetical protein
VKLIGKNAGGFHHGQESSNSTKGRIHWRRPVVLFSFRLQTSGGPYIAIFTLNTAVWATEDRHTFSESPTIHSKRKPRAGPLEQCAITYSG